MPGHGNVLAAMENGDYVDLLIVLTSIGNPTAMPDIVAVSLPWAKCTEDACGKQASEMGMTFNGASPADVDEFMSSWAMLNQSRFDRNAAIDRTTGPEKDKGKKKATPTRKKRDSPSVPTTLDKTAEVTGEGSRSKKKTKTSKELKLTLDEALLRGNKMSTKTPSIEVDAIYKALEAGLGYVFPYQKRRLPGVIPSSKLHIAPDELKYRKIAKERLGQVPDMNMSHFIKSCWYRLAADISRCRFANQFIGIMTGLDNIQGLWGNQKETRDSRASPQASAS